MKTQTQFRNASLVSMVNGTIIVKNSTGEHTFTNASVVSVNNGTIIIESKKCKWKPNWNEKYYYIDATGKVTWTTYNTFELDPRFIKYGNCFQTEDQAQKVAEKVKNYSNHCNMNFTFHNSSIVSVNSGTIVLNVSGKTRTFVDAKLVSAVDGKIVLDLPNVPLTKGAYKTIHLTYDPMIQRTFISNIDNTSFIEYYITQYEHGIKFTGTWGINSGCRNATPEEIEELNAQLAAEGKCWNPDTMQIEKLRWKPKRDERYYLIDLFPLDSSIKTHRWVDDHIDLGYYKENNCFKTEEEAEKKLKQIKQILANG